MVTVFIINQDWDQGMEKDQHMSKKSFFLFDQLPWYS